MDNWDRRVQEMIGIMDGCIKTEADEALTLRALSDRLGYSQAYVSRRFHRSAGMTPEGLSPSAAAGLCPEGRAGHGGRGADHRGAVWLLLRGGLCPGL